VLPDRKRTMQFSLHTPAACVLYKCTLTAIRITFRFNDLRADMWADAQNHAHALSKRIPLVIQGGSNRGTANLPDD